LFVIQLCYNSQNVYRFFLLQIISNSNGLSFITTVTPQLHPHAHFLGDVVVQEVDLAQHGFNSTVSFQVKRVYFVPFFCARFFFPIHKNITRKFITSIAILLWFKWINDWRRS